MPETNLAIPKHLLSSNSSAVEKFQHVPELKSPRFSGITKVELYGDENETFLGTRCSQNAKKKKNARIHLMRRGDHKIRIRAAIFRRQFR